MHIHRLLFATLLGSMSITPALADEIVIRAYGDVYRGEPTMVVKADDRIIGSVQVGAAVKDYTFKADIVRTIAVGFTNDLYGGTPATDRNLRLVRIGVNGEKVSDAAAMMSAGQRVLDVSVALKPKKAGMDGVCGPLHDSYVTRSASTAGLCRAGAASPLTGGTAPVSAMQWSCAGSQGGKTAQCEATLIPDILHPKLLLPRSSFFAKDAKAAQSPKKVFAHYMPCQAFFGGPQASGLGPDGGIQAAKQEILMAQSMGLDGFAIEQTGWDDKSHDAQYNPRVARNLFAAAQQLGSGFKLFFTIDREDTAADILAMLREYGRHPNYHTVNGLPMLNTYEGVEHESAARMRFWRDDVLGALKKQGMPVHFVPFFSNIVRPDGVASESPQDIQNLVRFWSPIIDGMSFFGAANNVSGPYSITEIMRNRAEALHARGKSAWAGFSHSYWGTVQSSTGRNYVEYDQGIGMHRLWQSVMKDQAEGVILVTWNDANESFMAPIDDLVPYNPGGGWKQGAGWYKSRRGYSELDRYYIQWYKTGLEPTISKDSIFYFYRTHGKDLTAPNDPWGPISSHRKDCAPYCETWHGKVQDVLYLSVPLTAPATLKVKSGGKEQLFNLNAGINQLMVPFSAGEQTFSLLRSGKTIASVTGDPILSKIDFYNFWNTTGFVEVAP